MSYSISSYTEDSFTFAACHGNHKDEPDGGDDDDDNDDKYLSKHLQNPRKLKKLTSNYTKKLIPKNSQTIPGLKIEANPDPENPGIFTKSRPENPGIEIVDPARACH